MAVNDLTAQRLRELYIYDPETGIFIRILRPGSRRSHVGFVDPTGYTNIGIDGKSYRAHRLAWLYVTGAWPANYIDHINGARSDNRFSNLRDVTHSINRQNLRGPNSNKRTSQFLGVYQRTKGSWAASINVDGKKHRLGSFRTAEAAHAAYLEAKRRLHPGCTI